MRTEGNIARIFHHEGQKIAEDRILQSVELHIPRPDAAGTLCIALRIGVENVL